jgi:deoxycytidylate deaminase
MINARVKRVVIFTKYADDSFKELFREAGITVDILEKPSSTISFLE